MQLYALLIFNPSQIIRKQSTTAIKIRFKSAATQPCETWVSRLSAGECNVPFGTVIWKWEARGVQRYHLFYTMMFV